MDLLPADAATLILSSGWPLFLSPLARVELSVDMNDAGFVIIDLDCFSAFHAEFVNCVVLTAFCVF